MKITVFQSGKGDCLLIESQDGKRMLVDGGVGPAYEEHVAPALEALHKQKKAIDLVYLSHIDDDHIGGVLRMFDHLVEWRVYEYHSQDADGASVKKPKFPRPAEVKQVWHNAFHEQLGKNSGPIENMLAATAVALTGIEHNSPQSVLERLRIFQGLATSTKQAIQLTRRLGEDQLGIPVNAPAEGKLMLVREGAGPISVGCLRVSIIGPHRSDLEKLRAEWNDWLRENKEALKKIRQKAKDDADRLAQSDLDRLVMPLLTEAEELGNRRAVTTPNLASLMLLVEEAGSTVLLTGDGHCDDVVKGLRSIGRLDEDGGGFHASVLKVPHHGSEHNSNAAFAKVVTADNYVFCGNGEHENPDLRILDLYANSRFGAPAVRSKNAEVGKPFTFWFNSSSAVSDRPDHMREVETRVRALQKKSKGKMRAKWLKSGAAMQLSGL